jgi:hypothetical protein
MVLGLLKKGLLALTLEVFEVEEKLRLWNLYKGVVKVG